MKSFTRCYLVFALLLTTFALNAQSLYTSGSRDAGLYSRSGLTSDVDKTNLNADVNIYSYNNSIYISTSETNFNNAKYAVFTLSGKMVCLNNISSTLSKKEMEENQKGLFIVKALLNGKIYTKKVYIY